MRTIQLVNQSVHLNEKYMVPLRLGAQVQANNVTLDWGLGTVLISEKIGEPVNGIICLVDQLPDGAPANVFGYHTLLNGVPIAYVLVPACISIFGDAHIPNLTDPSKTTGGTDLIIPFSVSEVISHELAEMIIDPDLNRYASEGNGSCMLVEIADQADAYRYVEKVEWQLTINGVTHHYYRYLTLQDYVTPDYYREGFTGPCSHTGKVRDAFTLNPGCYAATATLGNLTMIGADEMTTAKKVSPKEPPHPWLCSAGVELRNEVNARWPHRTKASDGWIGDARHRAQGILSQHNPDPITGCVRAIDIDIHLDPEDKAAAWKLADALREIAAKDSSRRIWYIIFDHQITSATYPKTKWKWRKFGGDPHTSHIHISFFPSGDHNGKPFL